MRALESAEVPSGIGLGWAPVLTPGGVWPQWLELHWHCLRKELPYRCCPASPPEAATRLLITKQHFASKNTQMRATSRDSARPALTGGTSPVAAPWVPTRVPGTVPPPGHEHMALGCCRAGAGGPPCLGKATPAYRGKIQVREGRFRLMSETSNPEGWMRCWEHQVPLFTLLGCLGRVPSLSMSHCIPIQHISLFTAGVLSRSLRLPAAAISIPSLYKVCFSVSSATA